MKKKSLTFTWTLISLLTNTFPATAVEPTTEKAGEGCTIAVISGKATTDGRPLLWKNRDIRRRNNKVIRFTVKGMSFIGLVTTGKNESKQVWAGINQSGFAIMNSAANDLPGKGGDKEGFFMKQALANCRSVDDFAQMLKRTAGKGRGVKANFGAIDARGGAAIFETSQHQHCRFDANNPHQAPLGFVVRANCALTGTGKGSGFGRYQRALELFTMASQNKNLNRDFLLRHVARDLFTYYRNPYPLNSIKNQHPIDTATTINRRTTVSVSLFHGVTGQGDPRFACYWLNLGNPSVTPAVPLFVAAEQLPPCLTSPSGKASPFWNYAEKLYQLTCVPGKKSGLQRPPILIGKGILPRTLTCEAKNTITADHLLKSLKAHKPKKIQLQKQLANLQNQTAKQALAAIKQSLQTLQPNPAQTQPIPD